ncbi:MAG: acetyltransferase [Acidimicrobiales bacterium]|nr:acetyltransferase [Acidimicrobiales bacterium]
MVRSPDSSFTSGQDQGARSTPFLNGSPNGKMDEMLLRLQDDRLLLRTFTMADVADVTRACQDPEMARWTASIPSPYDESHARSWIEMHDQWRAERQVFPFAIVARSRGTFLGCISVHPLPSGAGEVGYWVAAWGRGQGVATSALELVTGWACAELELTQLELGTVIGNTASERVAQKAGYRLLGEQTHWVHGATGKTFHVKRWAKTRPSFQP